MWCECGVRGCDDMTASNVVETIGHVFHGDVVVGQVSHPFAEFTDVTANTPRYIMQHTHTHTHTNRN